MVFYFKKEKFGGTECFFSGPEKIFSATVFANFIIEVECAEENGRLNRKIQNSFILQSLPVA